MAQYPGEEKERRIPVEPLMAAVTGIFAACGMREGDATLLASTLVLSDLRGIHSHGVLRVPDYVKKLTQDGVDPRGTPRIVHETGAIAVVDGGNSMGQIGGAAAMRVAIDRARRHGIGAAALRGSNHCGAMDYYAMLALSDDMIGIAMTNSLPTMAPWGGTDKLVGINPVAIAVPAGAEQPLVLDIAFGETAHGKIRVYAQKGFPIPGNWALDVDGHPTIDATQALAGLIRPIGGHKGVGLAMITGILSSLLSGAAYGTESGNMVDGAVPGVDGQFFAAVDVAAFGDLDGFKARVDRLVREIHASRKRDGIDRLYVPGEMEAGFERTNRARGIPLNESTLSGLRAAGAALRVPSVTASLGIGA